MYSGQPDEDALASAMADTISRRIGDLRNTSTARATPAMCRARGYDWPLRTPPRLPPHPHSSRPVEGLSVARPLQRAPRVLRGRSRRGVWAVGLLAALCGCEWVSFGDDRRARAGADGGSTE